MANGYPGGVPPMSAVGDDYLRKKKELYPGEAGDIKTKEYAAKAWEGLKTAGAKVGEFLSAPRGEGMMPPPPQVSTPAATGAAKQAEGAVTQAAAHQTAVAAAPEAQPDRTTPTTPTSTGGAGPKLSEGDRLFSLPGEQGYAVLHERGPDPATRPGGFAYSGRRAEAPPAPPDIPGFARGTPAEELGGGATVRRGPEGATGGHSWTLRTPSHQEAAYDASRYKMQTRARQAGEEAVVSEREAAGARAGALTEQPFAPEMAEVAGKVGEQRARMAPEMRAQSLAMDAFMAYQQKAASIDADPDLSPEEKQAMKRDAEREAWMSIIAVQPRARKPEEGFMSFGATPSVEEPT